MIYRRVMKIKIKMTIIINLLEGLETRPVLTKRAMERMVRISILGQRKFIMNMLN